MWCGAACLQIHVAQPYRHSTRCGTYARVERHDAPHHHNLRLRRARYKSVHARLSPACVHVASLALLFLPLETCCLLLCHLRTQNIPCITTGALPMPQLSFATITPNSSAISGLRCVGVVAGSRGWRRSSVAGNWADDIEGDVASQTACSDHSDLGL